MQLFLKVSFDPQKNISFTHMDTQNSLKEPDVKQKVAFCLINILNVKFRLMLNLLFGDSDIFLKYASLVARPHFMFTT